MSYVKQNFKSGQVLKADHLNHMEAGIAELEQQIKDLPSGDAVELTIGTVTSGETASASIVNGRLNLVLPRGAQGPQGERGLQGETGPQGPTGATGATGAAGPAGANGKDGTNGKDGAAGAKGDKGDPGPAGPGFSDSAKGLILSLFEGAAYGNDAMQAQLDELKTEFSKDSTVAVRSVSLNKSTLSLTVGGSETLTATVLPSNATDRTVTWTVSPAGYATVSGGVVKAVAAGNCTVTASSGGKSAACAVTVAAASTSTEDIPGETPVYKLAQATEFTPAKAQCIDTGIKMLSSIDPKPSYTILFEVQYNENIAAKGDTYVLLHCMEESSPWPGLTVAVNKSGELQMSIYGYRKVLASRADLIAGKRRFAVQFSDELAKVWGYDGSFLTGGSPISSYTAAVNKSLLLGAYQTSDGEKGRYFDGTLYQCLVYNKALDSGKIVSWITG